MQTRICAFATALPTFAFTFDSIAHPLTCHPTYLCHITSLSSPCPWPPNVCCLQTYFTSFTFTSLSFVARHTLLPGYISPAHHLHHYPKSQISTTPLTEVKLFDHRFRIVGLHSAPVTVVRITLICPINADCPCALLTSYRKASLLSNSLPSRSHRRSSFCSCCAASLAPILYTRADMASVPLNRIRPSLVSMPTPTSSSGKKYADPAFEPNTAFAFEDAFSTKDDAALSPFDSPKSLNMDFELQRHNPELERFVAFCDSSLPSGPKADGIFRSDSEANLLSSAAHVGRGNGIVSPEFTQAQISKPSPTVAEQFGHITPPDDDISSRGGLGFTINKAFRGPVASVESPVVPCPVLLPNKASISSRSERARNAANHRHSRSKPLKRESVSTVDGGSEPEENGEPDHKREKYREKNRVAAAKCRAKKKMNSDHLEGSARETERENTRLKLEERKLRDELTRLKEISLAHHAGGCKCASIHAYNTNQALRTAQGATGALNSFGMASPCSGSSDSPTPFAFNGFGSTMNGGESFRSSINQPEGAHHYTGHQQLDPQQLGMMHMLMNGDDGGMHDDASAFMSHELHSDFHTADGQSFAEYLQTMEADGLDFE